MKKGKHSSGNARDISNSRDIYSNSQNVSRDIYSSTKRKKKKRGFDRFLRVFFVIETLILIACIIYIGTMQLLPASYIVALVIIVALFCGMQMFLKLKKSRRGLRRVLSLILSVVMLCVTFYCVGMLGVIHDSVKTVTGDDLEVAPNDAKVAEEPFIVYLSGSDTRNYSEIPEKGLSDVNMVVAVDPVNHKMLMINTPRDYYVALYGDSNKMDKLTHAGNFGVECSMQTLEALYDIEFNYYAKINFKSVVDIVDALGGIKVNSELAFSSRHSLSEKTYSFVVGENELNGDAALAFVRERESFAAGDRQRGKNQQLVISAIVDKAISPAILNISKFKEVLSAVTSNTKTNISSDAITALFRMQLADMSGWDIQSISVDGTGSSRSTYTVSSRVYVMIPDEETVNEAKTALAAYK